MKLKILLCAGLLAAGATTSVFAEDIDLNVNLIPNIASTGVFSAGFGLTHTQAGSFTDNITFMGASGGAVAFSSSLVTIGFVDRADIDFTSVAINGQTYTLTDSGGVGVASFDLAALNSSSPLVLEVMGIAGPNLTEGSDISASYAGTVNVSPVPEAGTLAMMLAGLGVMGTVGRRRMKD